MCDELTTAAMQTSGKLNKARKLAMFNIRRQGLVVSI
jgi:hypothetical protein